MGVDRLKSWARGEWPGADAMGSGGSRAHEHRGRWRPSPRSWVPKGGGGADHGGPPRLRLMCSWAVAKGARGSIFEGPSGARRAVGSGGAGRRGVLWGQAEPGDAAAGGAIGRRREVRSLTREVTTARERKGKKKTKNGGPH